MAAGRRRLQAETQAAWEDLSPLLPSLSRTSSLQELESHAAAICRFADCARHFLLLNKDDASAAALTHTICTSDQHAGQLLAATRQALLLLVTEYTDKPMQVPQQGVWLTQRLCETVTDVFYVFWSRLQKQGANSIEGVWVETDKVHSIHTRMLFRMSVQSRILHCLSGACELVANLLTHQRPAKTLKALTGQQYATYAALASLAEALIATWRALARFWPECQLLVDNQLSPMRDNPMTRSVPAMLQLCDAVLSSWPGPAPLPPSCDPTATLNKPLQDRVQAPTLKPAEVEESLRRSAVEALALADKLVFVLCNEVLIRTDGVDVTQDPDLEKCITSEPMQDVMLSALATFFAVRHTKLKGVSPCTPPVPNSGTAAAAAAAAASLAGGAGSSSGSGSAKAGKKGPGSSSSSHSSGKAKQKQQGLSIRPFHTGYLTLAVLTGIEQRAAGMATERNTAAVFTAVLVYLFTARYQGIKAARTAGFWEADAAAVTSGVSNDMRRVMLAPVLMLLLEQVMLAPELEHLWSALQIG